MNEYVSTSHPDWAADFRAFDRQLRAAPLLVLASPPSTSEPSPAPNQASGRPTYRTLCRHAVARGQAALWNGQIVTLIGIDSRTTAHVIDDRYRHHRIPITQISHLIKEH